MCWVSNQMVAGVVGKASSSELIAGRDAGSPMTSRRCGAGAGAEKPVPWTVASMVSPARAPRAQALATPSCSANSKQKVPVCGSGSTRVYARWCGRPAFWNQTRTHIVGWSDSPAAASSPPSVKYTRR